MGSDGGEETKHQFSPGQAAEFLRGLADALEHGRLELGPEELAPEGEVRVKQSLREKGGRRELKLKIKLGLGMPQTAAPDDTAAAPAAAPAGDDDMADLPGWEPPTTFKRLKKHMAGEYKSLRRALASGQAPEPISVAALVADGRLMIGYPGKGEEGYAAFGQALDALEAAAAAGDVGAMSEALSEMGAQRRKCHAARK